LPYLNGFSLLSAYFRSKTRKMYNNSKLHSICLYRTCVDVIQNLHILSSPTAQQNCLLATITRRSCTQFRTVSNRRFQCYCWRFWQDYFRAYWVWAKRSGKKTKTYCLFKSYRFKNNEVSADGDQDEEEDGLQNLLTEIQGLEEELTELEIELTATE